MITRVGINGFTGVGRAFTRLALDRADLEVVAVNDITDAGSLAHLLEYDSTYGRLGRAVTYGDGRLLAGDTPIAVLVERDPARIDWARWGAGHHHRVHRQVPDPGRGRDLKGGGAEGGDLGAR